VDKTSKQLGIFRPSKEFVERGEQKVIQAIEVHRKFFGENPTYDINEYYVEETL
jgi:hypothetical protein